MNEHAKKKKKGTNHFSTSMNGITAQQAHGLITKKANQ